MPVLRHKTAFARREIESEGKADIWRKVMERRAPQNGNRKLALSIFS
jgi:hypothetical protein